MLEHEGRNWLCFGGEIRNHSPQGVWITGDGNGYWLLPNQSSCDIGVRNGNGLLLDGRRVKFVSKRKDLGGGRVFTAGAIKVCNLGTLTVTGPTDSSHDLAVTIHWLGFITPFESAGYRTPAWCRSLPDLNFYILEINRERAKEPRNPGG